MRTLGRSLLGAQGKRLEIMGDFTQYGWHDSCEGIGMRTSSITRVEFMGGPEDGLVLNAQLFRVGHEDNEDDTELIPVVADHNERDEFTDEILLLGYYVIGEVVGKTLRYDWKG